MPQTPLDAQFFIINNPSALNQRFIINYKKSSPYFLQHISSPLRLPFFKCKQLKKERKPNNKSIQNSNFEILEAIKKIALYTGTSTYRNEVIFFASTKQKDKSPSEKCANAYTFGYNGQEKVDEIAGAGNHTTAEFWEYDTRLGRRWNRDPVVQIGISDYAAFNDNPIYFNDASGDIVKVHVGNKAVGFTRINLFSAPEVKRGFNQVHVRVPVYKVTISNESGKSLTFLYTRFNQRANVLNNNKVEDRTFDVNKNGDVFTAVTKPRWNTSVLELRNPSNVNDQHGVIGMKGDVSYVERVAIQFHPLGASDGCLLAVGNSNLLSGSTATSSYSSSGKAHTAFMNAIRDFQDEDKKNGFSKSIYVEFDRLHDNPSFKSDLNNLFNKLSGKDNLKHDDRDKGEHKKENDDPHLGGKK